MLKDLKAAAKCTIRYKQNLDNSKCFLCSQFGEVKEPWKESIAQICKISYILLPVEYISLEMKL